MKQLCILVVVVAIFLSGCANSSKTYSFAPMKTHKENMKKASDICKEKLNYKPSGTKESILETMVFKKQGSDRLFVECTKH